MFLITSMKSSGSTASGITEDTLTYTHHFTYNYQVWYAKPLFRGRLSGSQPPMGGAVVGTPCCDCSADIKFVPGNASYKPSCKLPFISTRPAVTIPATNHQTSNHLGNYKFMLHGDGYRSLNGHWWRMPPFMRQCWGLLHKLAQCTRPQGWGS